MLNIAVTGAAGRMGRTLIQACSENSNCQLGAAIEHESSPFIGNDAGEIAGLGRLNTHRSTLHWQIMPAKPVFKITMRN